MTISSLLTLITKSKATDVLYTFYSLSENFGKWTEVDVVKVIEIDILPKESDNRMNLTKVILIFEKKPDPIDNAIFSQCQNM